MQYASRFSACRRELNSHDAAKPQTADRTHDRCPGLTTCSRRIASLQTTQLKPLHKPEGWWARRTDDLTPPRQFEQPNCVATGGFHPVHGAAANNGALRRSHGRRLEDVARQHRMRGTGGNSCWRAGAAGTWQISRMRKINTALPNPSVEARPNGKAPGPPPGFVYHPSGGPGASPSAPPHLER